ncbi:2-dehydropantoate 2-reductase N-terminal domain-containing protein [Tsukamurella sp. NPDC003166]|uniref:ketopantoate reductase family protein n=1 Tax=Tsukamurella sp. NPDC003166 TaxID=3154444 RepID=UPI0033BDA551
MSDQWRVAIIGAGAIGSVFALKLADAGHDVTMVVRNPERRAAIEADGVRGVSGGKAQRAAVTTAPALEGDFDLVIAPVQRQQFDDLVPTLAANGSRRIMPMLNNATDADGWNDQLGADRVTWGFPAIVAENKDGVIEYSIVPGFVQSTTVGRPDGSVTEDVRGLKALFDDAGIPTVISERMDSWLKTHAAVVAPMVAASFLPAREGIGPRLGWKSASALGAAVQAGLRAVSGSGATIDPSNLKVLQYLPAPVLTALLVAAFSTPAGKGLIGTLNGTIAQESATLLGQVEALAARAGVDGAPLAGLRALVPAADAARA